MGDTTELKVPNGRLFLAAVIDLFSRFVVGWALSAVNDRHPTIKALDIALRRRCPGVGLCTLGVVQGQRWSRRPGEQIS